jgi:hypothetical protein
MTHLNSNQSKVTFTVEELLEAEESYEGFCLACGERRECCEPDARNYECEACGECQVFGAQELILMGAIISESPIEVLRTLGLSQRA